MMFTDAAVALREISNGVMFISSILLIGIFVDYIAVKWWRLGTRRCRRDVAVQAAAAIIILMTGHSVRAGSSWFEFMWLRLGWQADAWWVNALQFFILATLLVMCGKLLVTFAFARERWRWHLTIFIGIVSVAVPLIVAFVT